jgi:hypothetical protein
MVKVIPLKGAGSTIKFTSGRVINTVYPSNIIHCINSAVNFDENLLEAHIYRSEKKSEN